MKRLLIPSLVMIILSGCGPAKSPDYGTDLQYCATQARKTLTSLKGFDSIPRNILHDSTRWTLVGYHDWTSGFWPGMLWYLYEYSGDTAWKSAAKNFTHTLAPLANERAAGHDLGFQMMSSAGQGFRLTGDPLYQQNLLATADTLATLFNPNVGTILSWPWAKDKSGQHNTIIDNMMNLELLFWAAKHGGSKRLDSIARMHANTTMKNHFRPDYSAYHVLVYDSVTGQPIRKYTHQGFADSSMWARGQAWAIYGYTMCFRETGDPRYLDFAQHLADVFLSRLPEDRVPYWDFNAPDIPAAPRDASAASVAASALVELSTLAKQDPKKLFYRQQAEAIIHSLSSQAYRSGDTNPAFLLHCTGHKPAGTEIDASIDYGDYYYLEALVRLEKLHRGKSLTEKL